jgi:hypothetical protein
MFFTACELEIQLPPWFSAAINIVLQLWPFMRLYSLSHHRWVPSRVSISLESVFYLLMIIGQSTILGISSISTQTRTKGHRLPYLGWLDNGAP